MVPLKHALPRIYKLLLPGTLLWVDILVTESAPYRTSQRDGHSKVLSDGNGFEGNDDGHTQQVPRNRREEYGVTGHVTRTSGVDRDQ